MSERRLLAFDELPAVQSELERLLRGHRTLGTWSFGQIMHHLATALQLSMQARPNSEVDARTEVLRRRFFRVGRFPDGREVPTPALLPPTDADVGTQAERLRAMLGEFRASTGPYPPHPVLGQMTREEWERFHCIHCAHHLGFVIPTSVAGAIA